MGSGWRRGRSIHISPGPFVRLGGMQYAYYTCIHGWVGAGWVQRNEKRRYVETNENTEKPVMHNYFLEIKISVAFDVHVRIIYIIHYNIRLVNA